MTVRAPGCRLRLPPTDRIFTSWVRSCFVPADQHVVTNSERTDCLLNRNSDSQCLPWPTPPYTSFHVAITANSRRGISGLVTRRTSSEISHPICITVPESLACLLLPANLDTKVNPQCVSIVAARNLILCHGRFSGSKKFPQKACDGDTPMQLPSASKWVP
jgi:hypothetical protein